MSCYHLKTYFYFYKNQSLLFSRQIKRDCDRTRIIRYGDIIIWFPNHDGLEPI